MSTELRLVAIMILIASVFGVGVRYGTKSKQAEWDAATLASKDAQDKALQAAAEALRTMAPAQAKIIERVTHETTTVPVYRDCRNSAGGMRDINAALTNSQPSGDGPVPAASAPE
jgi:hypothetical protein